MRLSVLSPHSGWLAAVGFFGTSVGAAVIMLLPAILFSVSAALMAISIVKVSAGRAPRETGWDSAEGCPCSGSVGHAWPSASGSQIPGALGPRAAPMGEARACALGCRVALCHALSQRTHSGASVRRGGGGSRGAQGASIPAPGLARGLLGHCRSST